MPQVDQRSDGMNYIISGKNIDVTEGLRQAVYDKLGRLEKFFNQDTNAQVTFSVEKDRQKIEVTIPMKGHIIRAEQVSDDMYVSIDMVVEIIERQVTRYKKRIIDQEQDAAYFQNQFLEEEDEKVRVKQKPLFNKRSSCAGPIEIGDIVHVKSAELVEDIYDGRTYQAYEIIWEFV
jgi:ribosomal subunit interface protein